MCGITEIKGICKNKKIAKSAISIQRMTSLHVFLNCLILKNGLLTINDFCMLSLAEYKMHVIYYENIFLPDHVFFSGIDGTETVIRYCAMSTLDNMCGMLKYEGVPYTGCILSCDKRACNAGTEIKPLGSLISILSWLLAVAKLL